MNTKFQNLLSFYIIFLFLMNVSLNTVKAGNPSDVHVWEMYEVTLKAEKEYKNNYSDVTCWVE